MENGDICLIHHLSYPESDSIKNKNIDSKQISVTYSGYAVEVIAK